MSAEVKFKTNFFLQIVDQKDRFEQTHTVAEVFDFLINQERLLSAYQENNLLIMCKNFEKKLGDIDPLEMRDELERFVHVIKANKESLKTVVALGPPHDKIRLSPRVLPRRKVPDQKGNEMTSHSNVKVPKDERRKQSKCPSPK